MGMSCQELQLGMGWVNLTHGEGQCLKCESSNSSKDWNQNAGISMVHLGCQARRELRGGEFRYEGNQSRMKGCQADGGSQNLREFSWAKEMWPEWKTDSFTCWKRGASNGNHTTLTSPLLRSPLLRRTWQGCASLCTTGKRPTSIQYF